MISGPESLRPRLIPSNRRRKDLRSQKRPLLEAVLLNNTFTSHSPQANADWKRLKQLKHKSTCKALLGSRTQDWTTLGLTEKESQKVSQHYPRLTMKKLVGMSRILNATPEELLQDAVKTASKPKRKKTAQKIISINTSQSKEISTPLLITFLVLAFLLVTRIHAKVTSCMEEPSNTSFFSYFNETPQTFTECLLKI